MRAGATAAIAVTLAAGLVLAGLAGPVQAQGEEGLSFATNCQKLHCQFEIEDPDAAVEGNATSIEWTFGPNGTTAEGNPVAHTFESPGTYHIQVTVTGNATDSGGNSTANETSTATASQQVQVSNGSVPWGALAFGAIALIGSLALSRLT